VNQFTIVEGQTIAGLTLSSSSTGYRSESSSRRFRRIPTSGSPRLTTGSRLTSRRFLR
jgi:hypothetical protein